MAETILASYDVAVATIAERVAILKQAEESTPEKSPLRAFLGDLRYVYQQIAKELAANDSIQCVVEELAVVTSVTKAQGKVPFYVATSDALFTLTGHAYVNRGNHG